MTRGLKYFESHQPWAAICFRLIFSWVFSSSGSKGNMWKDKCKNYMHCWSLQFKVIMKQVICFDRSSCTSTCALFFPF